MASDTSYLLNNEDSKGKGWSINQKYETIIVGDAYCGKTTYLNELIKNEHKSNAPIMISDDNNKLEFWVEYKAKKAIFLVRDTNNQEKFRSLTQTHYRKAQCGILAFDINNLESFYNLPKWYMDIFSYCQNQANFVLILVGIKKQKNESISLEVSEDMIDKFKIEHDKVLDYCFIDLTRNTNLKEPFEILLKYFSTEQQTGRRSIAYSNYTTIRSTPISPNFESENNSDGDIENNTYTFNAKKDKSKKSKCCCIL